MRPPVLWHLDMSHYNEKARWALDYKHVPHERRSVFPATQMVRARMLRGGTSTVPVIEIDGERIGDSTRIIETIEHRWPEPPLYPADPQERRRALEVEDFFDEECGPYMRRVLFDGLLQRAELFAEASGTDRRRGGSVFRALFPVINRAARGKYSVNDEAITRARGKVVAAMDRVEAELGPSGYLVGDSFSVADLTAAAILSVLVTPPEFPYHQVDPDRLPEDLRSWREGLSERPAFRWVLDTYARHRGESAEIAA